MYSECLVLVLKFFMLIVESAVAMCIHVSQFLSTATLLVDSTSSLRGYLQRYISCN